MHILCIRYDTVTLYWPRLQFFVCVYVSFVCRYVALPGECYYNAVLSCKDYFSSSSVVSCAFCVLYMYLKFGHHPHPLGYLCANFVSFVTVNAELAHREKAHTQALTQLVLNHSLTQLICCPGNWRLRFGIASEILSNQTVCLNVQLANVVISADTASTYNFWLHTATVFSAICRTVCFWNVVYCMSPTYD